MNANSTGCGAARRSSETGPNGCAERRAGEAKPSGADSTVVLCGGFGAARFVDGLRSVAGSLTCVVNVGDDFDYLGVRVCPDLDSVLYALAGVFDEDRGWGPVDDSLVTNQSLARYHDAWFQLGDKDLALSLKRTELLHGGHPLGAVTAVVGEAWGVEKAILPATDRPGPTRVRTPDGWRGFQEYVVRERARAEVLEISYEGVNASSPAPGVLAAIEGAGLLVIAPSNPVSSIGPILAVPGIRRAIVDRAGPNLAISPIVLGLAPTTGAERSRLLLRERFMAAVGMEHTPSAVAESYRDLIDGFVVDERDHRVEAESLARLELPILTADTLAPRGAGRRELARQVLRFGAGLPVIHPERRAAS